MPDCFKCHSGLTSDYLHSIAERCKQELTWIIDSKAQNPHDREVAWIADCGCPYKYNDQWFPSNPQSDWFSSFTDTVVTAANLKHIGFDSCNVNWYKSGRNKLGWHQDNEPLFRFSEHDSVPILSLSIGSPRYFWLKEVGKPEIHSTLLSEGDLFFMGGLLQSSHRHKVAPSTCEGWRLNFTWGVVVNPPEDY